MAAAAMLVASTSPVAAQAQDKLGDDSLVTMTFNDVDIAVLIEFMSRITGKNFVIDSRVRGKVTIIAPTEISKKDAYKVFESVLDINGFSAVDTGEVTKIIPSPVAKSDNIDTKVIQGHSSSENPEDRLVTRLIPLKYASAQELKTLFTPMVPKGSVVLAYQDTNMLIMTATLSSINRILKIVKEIDKQSTGKKVTIIPVKNADAAKLVKNLTTIFTAQVQNKRRTARTSDLNIKMVADERTNSVILLSSKVDAEKTKKLIEILDQKVPRGEERIRVYYLEHANAENLAKVLLEIPTTQQTTSKKANEGQKKAPLLSSNIKIMADKTTNSLIIMADKEDYPVLEEVINKLDIPRAMVYIECLIMEVNVTRGLNVGTEWKAGSEVNGDSNAIIGGFGATSGSGYSNLEDLAEAVLPSGFSVGVLGKSFSIGGITFPDIQAVVQAFQNDKDVHILATPQILTTENEEAVITVGKNVPFQTRSAAESGSETYNSFEYKDVGITLKITPQISKDRLVRLSVYQELTKLDSVNQSSPDRPTTLKRQIETTIIVENANSVVIGGLIDESITKSTYKTPCLGDIPFAGWAFKSVSEGEDKTNLYVFITPRVVKNPLERRQIFEKKKGEIESIQRGEVFLYNKLNFDRQISPSTRLPQKENTAQPTDNATEPSND